MGYKKVGKNVVEVPVFDGNPKHWNEYLEKYGALICLSVMTFALTLAVMTEMLILVTIT